MTGVQTCALPILLELDKMRKVTGVHVKEIGRLVYAIEQEHGSRETLTKGLLSLTNALGYAGDKMRSEERRVGKECRSRWSPYH